MASLSNNSTTTNKPSVDILVKLMKKRKLSLPCPLCTTLVVNLTDHLIKAHSVKNPLERKNYVDSVRQKYILSTDGLNELLKYNKSLKLYLSPQNGVHLEQEIINNAKNKRKPKNLNKNEIKSNLDNLDNDFIQFSNDLDQNLILTPSLLDLGQNGERNDLVNRFLSVEKRINKSIEAMDLLTSNFMIKFKQINTELNMASNELNAIKASLVEAKLISN